MDTNALLDSVKACRGVRSDYALAKVLAVSHGAISNYRAGRSVLAEPVALRVAELLCLDAGYVLACIAAERAARLQMPDVAQSWSAVAKRLCANCAATEGDE